MLKGKASFSHKIGKMEFDGREQRKIAETVAAFGG